ncbi:MAG: shikimate kinase [Thiomargarita sp.]|nr:shikimate kinase [Thiomargarita sp.]
MSTLNNIFLIGPMGVGKSTIGRLIAEAREMIFIDSDDEIEKQSGVTIPLIFEYEGEIGFRKREREIVLELTQFHNIILSTGGGVILDANNRHLLKNNGYMVYLHAPINDLVKRTAHSHNRPLLETENRFNKLALLHEERHPLYESVADLIIDTGQRSIHQVVKIVLKHLSQIEQT